MEPLPRRAVLALAIALLAASSADAKTTKLQIAVDARCSLSEAQLSFTAVQKNHYVQGRCRLADGACEAFIVSRADGQISRLTPKVNYVEGRSYVITDAKTAIDFQIKLEEGSVGMFWVAKDAVTRQESAQGDLGRCETQLAP